MQYCLLFLSRITRYTTAIIVLGVMNASLYAEPLTLPTAIDKAIANNRELSIASLNFTVAKSKIQAAWATILPSLSLETGYSRAESFQTRAFSEIFSQGAFGSLFSTVNDLAAESPSVNGISFDGSGGSQVQETYTAKVSVSQLLFGFHAVPALKAGKHAYLSAEYTLEATRQKVLFSVLETYSNALKAMTQERLAEEALTLLDSQLERVKILAENGLSTKADVLTVRVQLERSKQQLIQAKIGARIAMQQLNYLVGQPVSLKNELIEPKEDLFSKKDKSDVEWMDIAEKQRPDFQALTHLEWLQEQGLSVQKGTGLPMIFLSGYFGYGNTNRFTFDKNSEDWAIAVAGNWNFINLDHSSKVKEAKANLAIAVENKESLLEQIKIQVSDALLGVELADQMMKNTRQELALAKEGLSLTEAQLKSGAATSEDLLEATLSFNQARLKYRSALYDHQLALAKLNYMVGELSYESIVN